MKCTYLFWSKREVYWLCFISANLISGFDFFYYLILNQNLGVSLCIPKSHYQSQKQPVLPPRHRFSFFLIQSSVFCFRDTAGQERFRTLTSAYYRGAMVSRSYVIFMQYLIFIYVILMYIDWNSQSNIQYLASET